MAGHKRNKAGLHKEISSIFKGVRIPQTESGQKPSTTPVKEHTEYTEPKPLASELQNSETPKVYQATQTLIKTTLEHTGYTEPKPVTGGPQKPEVQQPKAEPAHLPKFVTAQQPKTEPVQPFKAGPAQRPKADLTQQPKVVPAQQPKAELTQPQRPKVVPAQRLKKADIDDIDKNVPKKITTITVSSQGFWQQIQKKLFKTKPGANTARQKAMVVMMPLLFIGLIFMLFRGGVFGTGVRKTETVAENNTSGVVTAGSTTEIEWELPAPYPTTLRDPMRLVPAAASQTEQGGTGEIMKLIVRSILYSEDNPSAVIGSRIVHEGEKIQGVSVIKINTDSVEFEMNGKRWTQMVPR